MNAQFAHVAGGLALNAAPGAKQKNDAATVFPASAADASTIALADGSMSLRITREQAADSHAETANGYVVYRGGQSGNVDVLERALPGGFDELLTFATAPRAPEVRYVIALEHGVAGSASWATPSNFWTRCGTPRLRASAPEIMDADCIPHEVRFALEGCSADHDGRGPWGRPVTTAGADRCTLRATWDSNIRYRRCSIRSSRRLRRRCRPRSSSIAR